MEFKYSGEQASLEIIKKKFIQSEIPPDITVEEVLLLFKEIGYESKYYKNGELTTLLNEYARLFLFFDCVFMNRYDLIIEAIDKFVAENKREKLKEGLTNLFNKVNSPKM